MYLETSEGTRGHVTSAQLLRLLERPAPLVALHGPGIALVALHFHGRHYALLHWNGRVWRRSTPDIPDAHLARLFADFRDGGGAWRENQTWDTLRSQPGIWVTVPAGFHVLLTFTLIFGGFSLGVTLGILAGRHFVAYDATLVYVFSILLAPPLAILGQYVARCLPAACVQCGEPVINLQTGRFSYLCTECGHLYITRWGINRSPMDM